MELERLERLEPISFGGGTSNFTTRGVRSAFLVVEDHAHGHGEGRYRGKWSKSV
jgi:hypothetical protein